MAQLSYAFNPAAAIEGMVAEYRESVVILSKLAQGLVPVGKLCAPGTNSEIGPDTATVTNTGTSPGQVIALPAGIVADPINKFQFTGIPIYSSSRQPYDATLGFSAYSDTDPCPVLQKGPIWVKPEATFTTEKFAVWVRVAAAGAFTVLGRFSNVSGAGLVTFAQGRWSSGCNASGLAILELW